MSNRVYNIYFHLHTVSGIVISVGLFIIFFAGAFTLYTDELSAWEQSKQETHENLNKNIDFDRVLHTLQDKKYDLYARDISIYNLSESDWTIYLSASKDSLASAEAKESKQLNINSSTFQLTEKQERHDFTVGELLYDLHFYWQLKDIGYALSGFVALFLLFALVTGLIIHWKKIISNFYVFRPAQKLKTVWTDAHTALGLIGIPFQFVYGLTGAMYGLYFLIASTTTWFNNGNEDTFGNEMYGIPVNNGLGDKVAIDMYSFNPFITKVQNEWEGFKPKGVSLSNYGTSTMEFEVYGYVNNSNFFRYGEMDFDVVSGTVSAIESPFDKEFHRTIWPVVHRLHFASYDLPTLPDYIVKALYFLLAMATCFVIITGVLIWLEARKKNKNLSEKRKRFNAGVGYVYLAICLSMFPITALALLVSKMMPRQWLENREVILNSVFFIGWLLLSIFFWSKKNNYFTNKYTLFSTAILGLCIPILNGIYTGSWFWVSFAKGQHNIFMIDLLWVFISGICFFVVWKLKKKEQTVVS